MYGGVSVWRCECVEVYVSVWRYECVEVCVCGGVCVEYVCVEV